MFDSVRALLASAVALLHGRLELAGQEWRRETERLFGMLLGGLAALFLLGLGMAFAAICVMVAAGDTYRLHAGLGITVLFLVGGGFLASRLRRAFIDAPRMFDATLSQLEKDHGLLDRVDAQRDQVVQQATQLKPGIELAERAIAIGQLVGGGWMLLRMLRRLFRRRKTGDEVIA
jgi:uncharacterized membrane protein YqjE